MNGELIASVATTRQPVATRTESNLATKEQTVSANPRVSGVASGTAVSSSATSGQSIKDIHEANQKRLEDSVSRLAAHVQSIQRDLQFTVDETSGRMVITVLDSNTDEVIRQIPSEEVLALAKNIESLKGFLFSAKV